MEAFFRGFGTGAGDGLRTRYLDLGKVALYQVSYSRSARGKIIPWAVPHPISGQTWYPVRLEDLFDSPFERARHRESEREARIVLARLDRVHRLPRHTKLCRQLRLGPRQLGAQHSQPVLHRYRQVKIAAPSAHNTAISGSTYVQFRCGRPAPSRNP